MHDPLIDDFTPDDDLDALAADLELGADQLALYRDQPLDGFLDETAARSKAVETEVQVLPIRRYPAPRLREVKYERAVDFVNGSPLEDLQDGDRYFAILSGKFVFGDIIEAYLFERDHYADEILIATLSMSQNNCDSLAGIIDAGRVKRLGLILSTYWYAVEMKRRVGYLVEHLGRAEQFDWAAVSLHTKIIMMREGDRYYVMHGSANMRSCAQLEQMVVERNEALYNFNKAWMEKVLQEFAIRPKKNILCGDELWQNGSVSGSSRNWSASNGTRAAARTAKRLSRSERAAYDYMRSEGLTDRQARESIQRTRNATRGRAVPF